MRDHRFDKVIAGLLGAALLGLGGFVWRANANMAVADERINENCKALCRECDERERADAEIKREFVREASEIKADLKRLIAMHMDGLK